MKSFDSKRIGLVSWDFRKAKGGLGRALEDIARTAPVHSVFAPSEGNVLFTKRRGGHFLFSLILQFRIASWITKNALNTILLPVGPGGVFLVWKPKNIRILAVVYHTYDQQSRLVPGQWWKRIFVLFEKRTLNLSDGILTYSQEAADQLKTFYRQPAEKIYLIPQLLDLKTWTNESFKEKEEQLCICVSRLEERKGIMILLHAWEMVSKILPGARLLIVGDGVLHSKVDQYIQKLGDSTQRFSHLSYEDLQRKVKKATLAIYPSYLEGFGLAVAEAMLAGTPVIASRVDGHASLVENDHTGVFFTSGNSEELSQAIIGLLRDTQRQKRIAVAAQQDIVKRFDRHTAEQALRAVLFAG